MRLTNAALIMFVAACGSGPKTSAQITTALAAAPTGTVEAASARQLIDDNLLRDGLATAMGAAELRIPYGYATLSQNACANTAKDSATVRDISLANTGDGVSTGRVIATQKCKSTGGFSFEFNLIKACVRDDCFDGAWNIEATDAAVTWSLRGYRQGTATSSRRLVDMGGSSTAEDDAFKTGRFVAYLGEREPQPTVVLEWGTGGPNKYTQFSLFGKNGKFVCASTDAGKTGDCSSVDANGKPTNTGDFSF